jgi:hypothetical protein
MFALTLYWRDPDDHALVSYEATPSARPRGSRLLIRSDERYELATHQAVLIKQCGTPNPDYCRISLDCCGVKVTR